MIMVSFITWQLNHYICMPGVVSFSLDTSFLKFWNAYGNLSKTPYFIDQSNFILSLFPSFSFSLLSDQGMYVYFYFTYVLKSFESPFLSFYMWFLILKICIRGLRESLDLICCTLFGFFNGKLVICPEIKIQYMCAISLLVLATSSSFLCFFEEENIFAMV